MGDQSSLGFDAARLNTPGFNTSANIPSDRNSRADSHGNDRDRSDAPIVHARATLRARVSRGGPVRAARHGIGRGRTGIHPGGSHPDRARPQLAAASKLERSLGLK
jgi:hypothetical protein